MNNRTPQKRYKSWALWLSVAALAAYIIKTVWGHDWATEISTAMDLLCPVLVGFGIINDPTNKASM